jgi:hypothetical protein
MVSDANGTTGTQNKSDVVTIYNASDGDADVDVKCLVFSKHAYLRSGGHEELFDRAIITAAVRSAQDAEQSCAKIDGILATVTLEECMGEGIAIFEDAGGQLERYDLELRRARSLLAATTASNCLLFRRMTAEVSSRAIEGGWRELTLPFTCAAEARLAFITLGGNDAEWACELQAGLVTLMLDDTSACVARFQESQVEWNAIAFADAVAYCRGLGSDVPSVDVDSWNDDVAFTKSVQQGMADATATCYTTGESDVACLARGAKVATELGILSNQVGRHQHFGAVAAMAEAVNACRDRAGNVTVSTQCDEDVEAVYLSAGGDASRLSLASRRGAGSVALCHWHACGQEPDASVETCDVATRLAYGQSGIKLDPADAWFDAKDAALRDAVYAYQGCIAREYPLGVPFEALRQKASEALREMLYDLSVPRNYGFADQLPDGPLRRCLTVALSVCVGLVGDELECPQADLMNKVIYQDAAEPPTLAYAVDMRFVLAVEPFVLSPVKLKSIENVVANGNQTAMQASCRVSPRSGAGISLVICRAYFDNALQTDIAELESRRGGASSYCRDVYSTAVTDPKRRLLVDSSGCDVTGTRIIVEGPNPLAVSTTDLDPSPPTEQSSERLTSPSPRKITRAPTESITFRYSASGRSVPSLASWLCLLLLGALGPIYLAISRPAADPVLTTEKS